MKEIRSSQSHPLQIGTLETPLGGRLGLTFCPGKRDDHAMTGAWKRDLSQDLEVIVDMPAVALVSLIETHEFDLLGVTDLPGATRAAGLHWYHLPIKDVSIPTPEFEEVWCRVNADLHATLRQGENIVIHCRGGLGRTGLVACRLLVEQGMAPREALKLVREARPGAVETREQEHYIFETQWAP